jgi:two-component system, OmpR family, sensor kinase
VKASFRLKLTLWNVAVLAFALTVFGAGLMVTNQQRVFGQVDRELRFRAERATENRGLGQQPPMMQGDLGEPPPGGQGMRPGQPPQNGFDRDPFGALRRPRFFDPQGQPLGREQVAPFDQPGLDNAMQGRPSFATVIVGEDRVRVFSLPRRFDDGRFGAIQVARELHDFDVLWNAQIWTLLVLLPIALVAAGVGAMFLTNRALRPIAEVTQAAAQITHADLSRRLPVRGNDELAGLATTFNEMIERLEHSFDKLTAAYSQLEHSYENQRRFIADASHELRTPLTRLRLATSAALAGTITTEQAKEALSVADRAGENMTRLVQQLLTLSKADSGNLGLQMRPLDLRVVASDAISECPPPMRQTVEPGFSEDPVMVNGDEDHLRRVFVNLIQNALRHTPPGGQIKVSVARDGNQAVATVADTGEGIAPEHLPHLGERFYRADAARSRDDGGSGLGLAICKSIVEAHEGRMRIESRLGSGTTVTIRLSAVSSGVAAFQTTSK